MCDRSKTEILARELAIVFNLGFKRGVSEYPDNKTSVEDFNDLIENTWERWIPASKNILESLNNHKE